MTNPAPTAPWWGTKNRYPPVGMSYGDFGVGKTVDVIAALGGPRTLVVCQNGGTTSATSWLKTPPLREKPIKRLEVLIPLFKKAAARGFHQIIVDDLSLMAEDTMADLETEYAGSRNNFAKWADLRDTIVSIRRLSRWLPGIGVWYTAHEAAPVTVDDRKTGERIDLPGGPLLPSKKQTETIPKQVEAVYRHTSRSDRPGDSAMARGVYEVGVTPRMAGKDRYAVIPGAGPANLRAALVHAGYTLPRWPHLTWQDSVMFRTADGAMEAGIADPMAAPPGEERAALWKRREEFAMRMARETQSAAAAKSRALLIDHIAWAIRDGLALAEYRKLNEERVLRAMFGGNPFAGATADDDDDDDDLLASAGRGEEKKGNDTPTDDADDVRRKRPADDDDDLDV